MAGLNSLAQGIMAGLGPGAFLGDRIAAARSNSRMQDIQDRLSSGGYSQDAAGQQQLQDDIRRAQEPLSARGMDDSYGQDQLVGVMNLQRLRGNQQAGDLVSGQNADGTGQPNYAPALAKSAATERMLGNLPGAMQADMAAGSVTAGRNAVNNSGQVSPSGVAPGGVDTTQLANATAGNMANFGDSAGAAQWGDQAQARGNASIQGMLGRGLTVATNPNLGGMQAAAPYFHSAAQMLGYGDVQYSKQLDALQVLDHQGNPVVTLSASANPPAGQVSLQQFAQTIGNDPTQLLGQIRAYQQQTAGDQRQMSMDDRKAARDAAYKLAGEAPSDAMLNQAERAAAQSQTLAERTGWKVLNASDETDASGAPTGTKRVLVQPPGGEPLLMTLSAPDPQNPTQPAFRLQRQDGSDIPASQLGGMAQAAQMMAQAQRDASILDNLKLNQARFQQGMGRIQDVYHSFGGGQGAMGAPSSPAPQAPQNVQRRGSPEDIMRYQSKYPEFDDAQMRQESGGQPGATSIRGAFGAMQMMPDTAREREAMYGLPAGYSDQQDALGVRANIMLGRQYRDELIDKYAQQLGDPNLGKLIGLAAYNWGPGNVDKWLAAGADPSKLPEETRKYVAAIAGGKKGDTGSVRPALATQKAASRNTNSGIMAAGVPSGFGRAQVPVEGKLPNGAVNKYLYKG